MKYNEIFKVLIVGDQRIGKSDFFHCLFEKNYKMKKQYPTIGVDFGIRLLPYLNSLIKLLLWDTSGAERFRTITKSYYKSAQGTFLCFDITNKESFEHLSDWLKEIKQYSLNSQTIVLVGTKSDLEEKRQVQKKDIEIFAKKNELPYFEVSSMSNYNINECLYFLLLQIINQNTINDNKKKKHLFEENKK